MEDAADWYEGRGPGLGSEFLRQIRARIETIMAAPERWPMTTGGTRRALVARFPYVLVYREIGEAVEIIAVAHMKRRPGFWKTR